jgi:membrane protein
MASNRFSRIVKILGGAVGDTDEIFQLEDRLERFVHFWALVTRQFLRHHCLVRASALSYATLLALIPLLVVALSVTSSLLTGKSEEQLTQFVVRTVSSITPEATLPANSAASGDSSAATNAEVARSLQVSGTETNAATALSTTNEPANSLPVNTQREVARWIHDLVAKASNGTLGVTGIIGLIITSISLLRGIEETFNDMWGVTRGRSWGTQIMLYCTIILLCPLFLSIALGLTGSAHFEETRRMLGSVPVLAPVLRHLLPILLLTFTLGIFYKLTPNTKVELGAAMTGGLCAGASWHIYNQLSFLLVARALSASKYYGSIFLIVLLMGGLYVLWVIILFGAQIAYACQNRAAYLQDRLAENVNHRGREFVALRIMTCIGRRFQDGLPAATVPEISTELGVPSRLTQSVLRTLAATRLVTEVSGPEAAFVPGRPLEAISAYDILHALRTGTGQDLPDSDAPELSEIYGEFARIEQAERTAAAGISLRALAARSPAPAKIAGPRNELPGALDKSGPRPEPPEI